MTQISSKQYDFQYFLGGKTKVNDLEVAAKIYGGATKYDDGMYSNIETDEFIKINENRNTICIFIPSTINVNIPINNTEYIRKVIKMLRVKYNYNNLKFYNTQGSWLDNDTHVVIIENITIVALELSDLSKDDINFCIDIAKMLKQEMVQQAVSLNINDSLCLI